METSRRLFLTGGTGYLGSALRQSFIGTPWTIYVQTRSATIHTLSERECSISHNEPLANVFHKEHIDTVIHLTGMSTDAACERNRDAAWEVNVSQTVTALRAAIQAGVRHFIFSSTASVYDRGGRQDTYTEHSFSKPHAWYGHTKHMAEQSLKPHANSIAISILRQPAIYGMSPRMRYDTLINLFVREAKIHGIIPLHEDGNIFRPIAGLPHVCAVYRFVIEHPPAGLQEINIVSENELVRTYADRIQTFAKRRGAAVSMHSVSFPLFSSYRVVSEHHLPVTYPNSMFETEVNGMWGMVH
ncbi:MAG: hypothetical protein A2898_05455 [Candidatus Kerfeldbacteria bacterium RIFCSPLOWO2_01_FULL_48_11]|uniref:NAD-dependent epimerase/dehydratase domain-containing protein n=1 Tax=Candidatus Kerfeldbacteria bacterium RIFCSPLOWO2_01_FULL_48_11 TaxID=1798543 RepID=A0A1G2B2N6_9BACT|nr:MAG: hypothetical protein A2898_05455 [Candidatus Kerfeldbacteria bacterium RIFCSPLOWO2_01_FULL_48_11]